jgi:hypothetical protein
MAKHAPWVLLLRPAFALASNQGLNMNEIKPPHPHALNDAPPNSAYPANVLSKPPLLHRIFGRWSRNMDGDTLLFFRRAVWLRDRASRQWTRAST